MATNITSRARVSPRSDELALGGALAGLGGGLAMAVAAALISLAQGGDIWLESRQIASLVYGGSAVTEGGFVIGPVVVGTLLHFVFSALFGALFGILVRRVLKLPTDFGLPLLCGLIYGFMIWMAAYFAVLPALNSPLMNSYAPSFIIQHLIYGMVTGLFYTKLRPAPYDERLTAEG